MKQILENICKKLPKSIKIDKHIGQRGVGDIIEGKILSLAKTRCNYVEPTGAKSTGDFSIICDNFVSHIDIKTHNINSKMSMPNLISIRKLFKEILNTNDELYNTK